ncbi:MAG: hypothetical protein QXL98_03065 [Thermofilaceae archaeon]
MQKSQVAIAVIVMVLAAACIFSIYQLGCYVTGRCPGTRDFYVTYATLALSSLYFLAVVYVLLAKVKTQKR